MKDSKLRLKVISFALSFLIACGTLGIGNTAIAWKNGSYSGDPNNPGYGTHDWIAEHAMNMLPSNESAWLFQNKSIFLYGTEAPDNHAASFQGRSGYGDTRKHHNYYSGTTLTDNSTSLRAEQEYQKALACLKNGSYALAAWFAGAMTHYIDDVASWPHVITSELQTAHNKFEDHVYDVTKSYSDNTFTASFDGTLETVSAFDAAKSLGQNTYSDPGSTHGAVWMNTTFQTSWSNLNDWTPTEFKTRTGVSINLAVNTVADVLHTLTVAANATGVGSGGGETSSTMTLIEIAVIAIIVIVAVYGALSRKRR